MLAISILSLVGGSVVKLEDHIGCNSKYDGIFESWRFIDGYLIEVDSMLCSKNCPCNLEKNTSVSYITNYPASAYYNLWWKSQNETTGAISFDNCTDTYKNDAYNSYLSKIPNSTLFNQITFSNYYNTIEQYFSCTGFCITNYFNDRTGTNMQMYKYLFSDVNR